MFNIMKGMIKVKNNKEAILYEKNKIKTLEKELEHAKATQKYTKALIKKGYKITYVKK